MGVAGVVVAEEAVFMAPNQLLTATSRLANIGSLAGLESGGPVGVQALAASAGEEENTILEVYEPYLLQLGFINRTRQGREATSAAYSHLKIKSPPQTKNLI